MTIRFRDAFYIGLYDILPSLKDPLIFVIRMYSVFLPVFFAYIFLGINGLISSLPGVIVVTFTFNGISVAGSIYLNKHWFKLQDIYVASGISQFTYIMGFAMGSFILSLPNVLISFGLLVILKKITLINLFIVLICGVALWIAFILIGFFIGTSIKSIKRVDSLPEILALLFGYLPPIYYSVSSLPNWLQPLTFIIPTASAAALFKHYMQIEPLSIVYQVVSWIDIVLFILILIILVRKYSQWVDSYKV
ncbi:hypothetical protein [Candidatus Harpocratesius sp.]